MKKQKKQKSQIILEEMRKFMPQGSLREDLEKEILVRCGKGSRYRDWNGKNYIDFSSGIFTNSFGHGFIRGSLAALKQNLLLGNVHSRHTIAEYNFYRTLSDFMPDQDYRFIPYCDGGYAVDRGISDIINCCGKERIPIGAFRGGFHGKTMGTRLAINETQKAALYDNFLMDYPYCYRCPRKKTPGSCQMECADAVCEALAEKKARAILFEPIQGAAVAVPPRGFWIKIRDFCTEHKIIMFADEVLTAGGRTGYFLASFGYYGISPDIIAITKGLANGHPLSVLCERSAITDNPYARRPGERMSTFAAYPEGLAISAELLKCLKRYHIFDHVKECGDILQTELSKRKAEFRNIGDVRSIGLMGAMELVTDRESKTPYPEMGKRVFDAARRNGLEMIDSGHILRIAPPLNISKKTLKKGMELLRKSLQEAVLEEKKEEIK